MLEYDPQNYVYMCQSYVWKVDTTILQIVLISVLIDVIWQHYKLLRRN